MNEQNPWRRKNWAVGICYWAVVALLIALMVYAAEVAR